MDLEKQFQPFSPPRTNLVEQVRYWASAQPEKLAFRFLTRVEENEESTLTYAQLDQKSDQLAAFLNSQGIGRGDLVGLCCDRNADTPALLSES